MMKSNCVAVPHTHVRFVALMTMTIMLIISVHARSDDMPEQPDYLIIGGGSGGVLRGQRLGYGALSYRFHEKWHGLYPSVMIGVASNARYAAFMLGYDYDLNGQFRLSLNIGPGLYEHTKTAPNLGSPIEFLSTLELSWRTVRQQRLAIAFGHLSNAHIDNYNPGTELLIFSYQIPMH